MLELFDRLKHVPWVQFLGAVVALTTSVHAFFVFLTGATGWSWAKKTADWSGIVAVDIGKALTLVKRLTDGGSKSPPAGGAGASTGVGGLLIFGAALVCLCAVSCTPAERAALPVLSTIDAVGIEVSHVLGWCSEHDLSPDTIAQAQKAVSQKDYSAAVELTYELLQAASKAGDPVPKELVAALEVTRGALAAEAIQAGMSALSTGGAPAK
jgi:hypothetical protein